MDPITSHAVVTLATAAASVSTPVAVEVSRTEDGEHYTGKANDVAFRYMLANRETAERERDKALRQAAAWQTILDSGLIGG